MVIASGKRPVNIPNPEAKADSADGTALGRVWESRTPPDSFFEGANLMVGPLKSFVAIDCVNGNDAHH